MHYRVTLVVGSYLLFALIGEPSSVVAQAAAHESTAESKVVLTNLSNPVYPQMAKIARVSGDVIVQASVTPEGSATDVNISRSDSPLLNQAALDSARQSRFDCRNCKSEANMVSLTYHFQFRDKNCGFARVRAPKCAYLWRCGAYRYRGSPPLPTHYGNRITILADCVTVDTLPQTADSSR